MVVLCVPFAVGELIDESRPEASNGAPIKSSSRCSSAPEIGCCVCDVLYGCPAVFGGSPKSAEGMLGDGAELLLWSSEDVEEV